jgi:hypothetical protein
MRGDLRECVLGLPLSDGRAIDFIEKRMEVRNREWAEGRVLLSVEIGRRQLEQLASGGTKLTVNGLPPHEAMKVLWPESAPKGFRKARPHESYAVGDE